jgi:hypothetical protein
MEPLAVVADEVAVRAQQIALGDLGHDQFYALVPHPHDHIGLSLVRSVVKLKNPVVGVTAVHAASFLSFCDDAKEPLLHHQVRFLPHPQSGLWIFVRQHRPPLSRYEDSNPDYLITKQVPYR